MAYWGRFNAADPTTLPVAGAFQPAGGREWLVKFWQLEGKWVGIAFPSVFFFVPYQSSIWSANRIDAALVSFLLSFSFSIITSRWVSCASDLILHYLIGDSNLVLNGSRISIPSAKTSGISLGFLSTRCDDIYCWIIRLTCSKRSHPTSELLLECILHAIEKYYWFNISRKAPIHTESLVVLGYSAKHDEEESTGDEKPSHITYQVERPIAVVEQRVSNLVQGSICLVLMTGPFLHVLHLIPRGMYHRFRSRFDVYSNWSFL